MQRLQRRIDAVLAVFLLAIILVFGITTAYTQRDKLYRAVTRKSRLSAYLPEDYDALDMFAARIRSFEATYNEGVWKKTELGYMNSIFQYSLGKRMVSTGASGMITLPTGDLYDLPKYYDTSKQTDEMIAFYNSVDVPMTVLYEHPTTYPGNMPEGGYAMLDVGTQMSDEIVSALRAGGIDVLDSRDILAGEKTPDIVLRTDQHWTTRAALIVARELAERMGLDAEKLDMGNFQTETFAAKFIGKFGQKVGPYCVEPDDITVYYPTYDTCIERYTLYNGKETSAQGSFKDAVIKWDKLEGEGWNTNAYMAYGLTEDFEAYHNEDAPDVTILLFRDSYSAPIGAFLSLVARDVYCVEMRKSDELAPYYVEKYQPDQILMAYSRQMLSDNTYDLLEGY